LVHLQWAHAFDPTPRREDLAVYHVPFDELGAERPIERALGEAALRAERIAVVGSSGSGKSNVIAHVLGPLVEGVAPILIPVTTEPAETIVEPRGFVGHLVQVIADYASDTADLMPSKRRDDALSQAAPTREPRRNDISGRGTVSLPWMGAELALELRQQTENAASLTRSTSAMLEVVHQVLVAIGAHGLTPVLIFDDTDRWLRGGAYESPERLAASFFGRALPVLVELPCALAVAVHREYVENQALKQLLGRVLEIQVMVPALRQAHEVGRILESRLRAHEPEPGLGLEDVFEPEAVNRLFEHYRERYRGELRSVLRTAHGALAEACDDQRDRISAQLVDSAVSTW